jgi:23S rRNA (guanosine2251-2'-O)-methyltransferase
MSTGRIVFGFHAVLGRLRQNPASVEEICVDKTRKDARMQDLLQLVEQKGVRLMQMDKERLDGMSAHGRHQGVLARVTDAPLPYQDIHDILESDLGEAPFFLVLDGVEDPHNLGACLRVADAMGAHAVIAPKDRAAGLNATVRKEAGVWLVGAVAEAEQDLFSAKFNGPIALVLGAEGSGLRRLTAETCDQLVSIPMFGTVESLNVSVASGICLYEARRQRAANA